MKITKIFALIFFAAAQIFAQESSEDSFNDIDFVQFGSSRKKIDLGFSFYFIWLWEGWKGC